MKSSHSTNNSFAAIILGQPLSKKAQKKIMGGRGGCGGCYLAYTDCGSGLISYVCCPSLPFCDCEAPC
jgi:hypothetical protein